jgi:hypothetical protein
MQACMQARWLGPGVAQLAEGRCLGIPRTLAKGKTGRAPYAGPPSILRPGVVRLACCGIGLSGLSGAVTGSGY